MRGACLVAMLATASAIGCASTTASHRSPANSVGQQTPGGDLERKLAQSADGSQLGKVVSVSAETLVVQPYESNSVARMSLTEPTPVFDHGKETSEYPSEALKPGEDVNVYFSRQAGGPPHVLAVRMLSPEEAQLVQQQLSAVGGSHSTAPSASADDIATRQFANADGSQAGELSEVAQDVLVLDPYDRASHQSVIAIDDATRVLRNGQQVAISTLAPGDDVRVFYQMQKGDKPKAVGIEVLSTDESNKDFDGTTSATPTAAP